MALRRVQAWLDPYVSWCATGGPGSEKAMPEPLHALLDWPLEREADLPIYLSADDKLLLARFGNSSKPVR